MKLDQDYLLDKSFLGKSYPDLFVMKDMMTSLEEYLVKTRDLINEVNDGYVSYLDNIASFNVQAVSDLKAIYSLVADLYVLNGKTANSFDLLALSKRILSSTGVHLNQSTNEISIDTLPNYSDGLVLSNISPRDIKLVAKTGQQLNKDVFTGVYGEIASSDIANIYGSDFKFSVYSLDTNLQYSILVDLGDSRPINYISFSINSEALPSFVVTSLQTVNGNALENILIANSNAGAATGYDLITKKDTEMSKLTINFENTLTRFIKINLAYNDFEIIGGRKLFAMDLNRFRIGFGVPSETGEVIFGPLKLTDEILKLSIDSVLENYDIENPNIVFSISPTKNGGYTNLVNSIEYNPDSGLKNVVNFNNIAADSVSTQNPIREVYLKVTLTSVEKDINDVIDIADPNVEDYIHRTRTTSAVREVFVNNLLQTKDPVTVLKETKGYSGYAVNFPEASLIRTYNLSQIESNGRIVPSSVYSETNPDLLNDLYTVPASTRIVTKPEKLQLLKEEKVICKPRFAFDQYRIKLFGHSQPIQQTTRVAAILEDGKHIVKPHNENARFVLPLGIKAGRYRVRLNGQVAFVLDFSSRVVSSITETYFIVANEDVQTYEFLDELDNVIGSGSVQTAGEIKYISIFDHLDITLPVIIGLTFNKLHGLVDNTATQFSLINQGFVFGSHFTGSLLSHRIIKTPLNRKFKNKRLILEHPRLIKYTEELIDGDHKKVFKLSQTNLLRGSVVFDATGAGINPFLRELEFINGSDEFNLVELGSRALVLDTVLTGFSGDVTSEILFDGEDDLFRNRVYSEEELIARGDWLLTDDFKIKLPEDISLSSIVKTTVFYPKAPSSDVYGLYSIDYRNGVIYTITGIDSKVKVEYIFSNTYAEYENFESVPEDQFSISDGQVHLKDDGKTDAASYLILYNKLVDLSASSNTLPVSPVVKNLKLNILTKTEIL